MKSKYGFSMIEIIIALIIIAIGFLPIYNLFRQGTKTTVSNVQETVATNYASDLINFCKDLRYFQIKPIVDDEKTFTEGDGENQIKEFIEQINPDLADNWKSVPEPYTRTLKIKRYDSRGWSEFWSDFTHEGWSELFEKKSLIPCCSIKVTVSFPRMMSKKKENDKSNIEEVTLHSILMD